MPYIHEDIIDKHVERVLKEHEKRNDGVKEALKSLDDYELIEKAVREVVMNMNGLSEAGFSNRMRNDPNFNKGYNIILSAFLELNRRNGEL